MPKKKSRPSAAARRKKEEADRIKSIRDKFSSSVYLVIDTEFENDDDDDEESSLRLVSPGLISKKDAIDILFANLERNIQYAIANIFEECIDPSDFDDDDAVNIRSIADNINRKGNDFSFNGLLSDQDKYTPARWYLIHFDKIIKAHMDRTFPEFNRIEDSDFTDFFNHIDNSSDSNTLKVIFEEVSYDLGGNIKLHFIEIPLGINFNDVLFNAQALVVPQFSKRPLAKNIKNIGFSMYLT